VTPLWDSIDFSSSAQALLKASLPSSWRRAASAATSIPASTNSASTCSALPPSAGKRSVTWPWSAKACRVGSGIVLTVKGAAKASM
jgi:hypothetical protein